MQRTNRGFTVVELLLVLGIGLVIATFVASIIYTPWILLWCLKSMGVAGVAYTSEAWWGALVAILFFAGTGSIGSLLKGAFAALNKRAMFSDKTFNEDLGKFADKFRELAREMVADAANAEEEEKEIPESPKGVTDPAPDNAPDSK